MELIKDNPSWCKNIKEEIEVTTYVSFTSSKLTHLSPLSTFSGKNIEGWSANFSKCKNLKVATGTFEGTVNFDNSGITTIKDLIIKNPNKYGGKATFKGCPIKYIPKEYRGAEYNFDKGVIKNSIKKDKIEETINKIKSETNNIEIWK